MRRKNDRGKQNGGQTNEEPTVVLAMGLPGSLSESTVNKRYTRLRTTTKTTELQSMELCRRSRMAARKRIKAFQRRINGGMNSGLKTSQEVNGEDKTGKKQNANLKGDGVKSAKSSIAGYVCSTHPSVSTTIQWPGSLFSLRQR